MWSGADPTGRLSHRHIYMLRGAGDVVSIMKITPPPRKPPRPVDLPEQSLTGLEYLLIDYPSARTAIPNPNHTVE